MIEVEHLTKSFPARSGVFAFVRPGPRRVVLDDVSFSVARGELLGLLGANGAGKTTLLHVLSTLARGDSGRVTIAGFDARSETTRVRSVLGLCGSAERGFYYRLSVRENLRFFAALAGLAGASGRRRIDEVLELVDLHGMGDRLYAHCSSGMRQRLAVARALLGDPPVLLFDEPTRAVDPVHAQALRSLIRTTLVERMGKTVVLATNVLDEAWTVCDRIAVLRNGRLAALDTPSNLARARCERSRYRIVFDHVTDDLVARVRPLVGSIRVAAPEGAGAPALEIELSDSAMRLTPLLRAISANGVRVQEITLRPAEPAEVFARLMDEAP